MKFEYVRNYVMPFGDYKDQKLDTIAESNQGLRYLDWLSGQSFLREPLKTALLSYLSDPSIKSEVQKALDR